MDEKYKNFESLQIDDFVYLVSHNATSVSGIKKMKITGKKKNTSDYSIFVGTSDQEIGGLAPKKCSIIFGDLENKGDFGFGFTHHILCADIRIAHTRLKNNLTQSYHRKKSVIEKTLKEMEEITHKLTDLSPESILLELNSEK